jgi:hypothetical protein
MSYIIKTYNGSKLTTVNEGSVDNKSTAIQLVGKNYAGYGSIQNDNFLFLLENFANEISPANPLRGQLWYDLQENKLKVYDRNSNWRSLNGADMSENYPNYLANGEFWFNQSNQLYIKTSAGPVLIGPSANTIEGTGVQSVVLHDIDGNLHTVLEAVIQDTANFIISNDIAEFVIDQTITPMSGFSTIYPGITMRNTGVKLHGTATAVDNGVYTTGSYNDPTWITGLAASKIIGDISGTAGSVAWANITGKPSFATVASTGSYADLSNKPVLFSGSYSDLTNKPSFATVATSGSYGDLSNKPVLFSGSYSDLTNKPSFATVATSGSYSDLSNKPTIPTVPSTVSAFTNDSGYITSSPLLGAGQAWTDVSSSRLLDTTYTNTTAKPIVLNIYVYRNAASSAGVGVSINGGIVIPISFSSNSGGGNNAVGNIIVPAGMTYQVSVISEPLSGILSWWELR